MRAPRLRPRSLPRPARALAVPALAALALAATACGPEYVRGSETPGLDDSAMSTGLDKRDMEKLLHENLTSLMASAPAKAWTADPGKRQNVAIYPLANETSEHVDSQLNALLSDVETFLVNTNAVDVVSVERQRQMIAEVEKQQGGAFNPNNIAAYNQQIGATQYLTGKVFSADERADEDRRVQYFMYMQLLDVATSRLLWQNKASLTKGVLND